MNDAGQRRRPWSAAWRWVLIALTLLAPAGIVAARQFVPSGGSPATGHAQVVTQGVAKLPKEALVWRLVERTAKPRGEADSGKRVLGFVLASDEPVLLTNVTATGSEDVARLAPGEALLVKAGTKQIRASLGDRPVTYLALELVPERGAADVGTGKLLFTSATFTAPPGERDLDLVRNVLALGETATSPNSGATVAILATDGAVEVTSAGRSGRTLQPGESAIFPAADLTLKAVAATNASSNHGGVAQLTNSLQTPTGGSSAYVVAVIGPEIPPAPKPSPTTAPSIPVATAAVVAPQATVAAIPTAAATVAATGSIAVRVNLCPVGVTIDTPDRGDCTSIRDGYDFALSGPAGDLTLADATNVGDVWRWSGLPLGQYGIVQSVFPKGVDSYAIPGSSAVGGSQQDGYTVTIDGSAPDNTLNGYDFQTPTLGSVMATIYRCPQDMTAQTFDPAACPQSGATEDFTLSDFSVNQLLEPTASGPGTVSWTGLALRGYQLSQRTYPRGYSSFLVDGVQYSDFGGPTYELTAAQPDVSVAVYDLAAPVVIG